MHFPNSFALKKKLKCVFHFKLKKLKKCIPKFLYKDKNGGKKEIQEVGKEKLEVNKKLSR
jgi:hypothetical protein